MERQLKEIVEKHLEGNYLVDSENKAKMISKILILFNVRILLIAFEESKHKFLSEKYRHEYAVKVVDKYLSNL